MIDVVVSKSVPNSTYFRTGDVEPDILDNNAVRLYSGSGTNRSWGRPGVNSIVVLQTDFLLVVLVGFYHKHDGGQFWRYFQKVLDGEVIQLYWRELTAEQKIAVLDAFEKSAPYWAKSPGKVKPSKPSDNKQIAFKLVGYRDGKLFSLYDEETEYVVGKMLCQKAQPNHGGGFYFYLTGDEAKALKNSQLASNFEQFALIEVEVYGTIIDYDSGKHSATYMRPIRVVEFLS